MVATGLSNVEAAADEHDVPFLNVAGRLLQQAAEPGGPLRLTVLRPPTFGRLSDVLRAAHAADVPYDAVHVDGHGLHGEQAPDPSGVLLFENPGSPLNEELVDGNRLGALLAETGVRLLAMNACRSAAATAATVDGRESSAGDSVATRVASAWPVAVVAMRYDVFETEAAEFVAALFAAVGEGQDVRRATSAARRALAGNRDGDDASLAWAVPVVLCSAPLRLPRADSPGETAADGSRVPADEPGKPRAGITLLTRDAVILDLEQAYLGADAVVLHGAGGIGKTSTARMFASWYRNTDAVRTVLYETDSGTVRARRRRCSDRTTCQGCGCGRTSTPRRGPNPARSPPPSTRVARPG
jgi:hypothetical protein